MVLRSNPHNSKFENKGNAISSLKGPNDHCMASMAVWMSPSSKSNLSQFLLGLWDWKLEHWSVNYNWKTWLTRDLVFHSRTINVYWLSWLFNWFFNTRFSLSLSWSRWQYYSLFHWVKRRNWVEVVVREIWLKIIMQH